MAKDDFLVNAALISGQFSDHYHTERRSFMRH